MNKASIQRMQVTRQAQSVARDFRDVDWFSGPNMMGKLPNVYTRSYHVSLQLAMHKTQIIIDALLQLMHG